MALTYTVDWVFSSSSTSLTSGSVAVQVGDVVLCLYGAENGNPGGTSPGSYTAPSNTGTALSWQAIANNGLVSGNLAFVSAYYAVATVAESITVSQATGSIVPYAASMATIVCRGAHASDPVPAGNRYGAGDGSPNLSDFSRTITPTSAGSLLFGLVLDWDATNSFAALAGCTLTQTRHDSGLYTSTLIEPTTNPRPDASAFTLGETDTSTNEGMVMFEVQAAAGASGISVAWLRA